EEETAEVEVMEAEAVLLSGVHAVGGAGDALGAAAARRALCHHQQQGLGQQQGQQQGQQGQQQGLGQQQAALQTLLEKGEVEGEQGGAEQAEEEVAAAAAAAAEHSWLLGHPRSPRSRDRPQSCTAAHPTPCLPAPCLPAALSTTSTSGSTAEWEGEAGLGPGGAAAGWPASPLRPLLPRRGPSLDGVSLGPMSPAVRHTPGPAAAAPPAGTAAATPTSFSSWRRRLHALSSSAHSLPAAGMELGLYNVTAAALGAWGMQRISAT
ncbi:hypothetical protein Agub_g1696, partial [Astrephomene gubernaculifera]